MAKIFKSPINKFKSLSRTKKIVTIIIILIVLIGGFFLLKPKNVVRQFVSVQKGSIYETVSVTGNTTPISSVSLGFGNGGIIARTNSSVGQNISQGQVLAELNSSDLYAQLKQAQANLDLQLAQNKNTNVNVDEVKKEQDILVANAYRNLLSDNLQAVPNDITDTDSPPIITGSYDGPEGDYVIHMYPSAVDGEAFTVSGIESGGRQVVTQNQVPFGTRGLYVRFPNIHATEYGSSEWTVSIPNTKSSTYTVNKNAYIAAQANRDKAIADAESEVESHNSGTTVSEAQIKNAEAAVQSIQAKLQNSRIVAPINGVVTQFDAKVGEFASAGTPLISIISNNSFEVDALVSETDIGKISLNNKVTMTLDAFPNEKFSGTVFYIDPAQTTSSGVVGYKIKVAFDNADTRLKSGLTANIDIETRHKEDVLYLPQYAILQNDDGTFVQVLENEKVKNIPVTLGLQDQKGNVEIVSGVTEGQQVLNIGLKQK